jgi:hypothetical protein
MGAVFGCCVASRRFASIRSGAGDQEGSDYSGRLLEAWLPQTATIVDRTHVSVTSLCWGLLDVIPG